MLDCKKIAVTGCIASGKSTVCSYLKKYNALVVDADKISHDLLNPETTLGKQILRLLGDDIVENNQFVREKIASLVFDNKDLLKALEALLHPLIIKEIETIYRLTDKQKYDFFVVDIPLLFEMKQESFYDYIFLIHSDCNTSAERFATKGFSKEEYYVRSENFLPFEEKKNRVDFMIQNSDSLSSLYQEIDKIMNLINHSNQKNK